MDDARRSWGWCLTIYIQESFKEVLVPMAWTTSPSGLLLPTLALNNKGDHGPWAYQ